MKSFKPGPRQESHKIRLMPLDTHKPLEFRMVNTGDESKMIENT